MRKISEVPIVTLFSKLKGCFHGGIPRSHLITGTGLHNTRSAGRACAPLSPDCNADSLQVPAPTLNNNATPPIKHLKVSG
jgi:hypothetical protein